MVAEAAVAQGEYDIDEESVAGVLRSFRADVGQGLDWVAPRGFLELPVEALTHLVVLLTMCVNTLTLPMQAFLNAVVLIMKASGGRRGIALTVAFYRILCKVLKTDLVEWEAEHLEWWVVWQDGTPWKGHIQI